MVEATNDLVEVTAGDFEAAVIEESFRRPVLVDFWADWCSPCQMLMPVLAKLVDEYAGKFRLAKVNSDEQQGLASQFGVRSLPTVMCFRNGKPVDQFMGVQPESAIRAIIDKYLERPSDRIREQALARLEAGDVAGAVENLRAAVATDPEHHDLKIDLARALVQAGDAQGAEQQLNLLPMDVHEQDAVKQLRARLVFAKNANGTDLATLEQAVRDHADDPEALERLAAAYMVAGRSQEAMDLYLKLMQRHRSYNDNAGQKGLLAAFEVLGPRHELVGQYRRRMVSLLY
ncbi:Thioredoxin domain-containing protein YbbN [Thioalkalivibrio nitratireducens DSM 14787]|uniref:Thioredoxin n=1 Tax=Thioalkalivibrio nitratireducens (strain DSM 14787 / UNIQEM 213 / ALEN2) TaxID=1255043 RepID=L0DZF7_THIND|nr:thioredoxin [Thioalkalivibrio nitratireducens]AGA34423.1 Thioredoxin domain-containing protein YbbN [Thioalkalivibrio nitratireducens DSM 14787]